MSTATAMPSFDPIIIDKVRNVRLYGWLGTKYGRAHRFAVRSCSEAVQALIAQFPGFEADLVQAKERGFVFAVFYGKQNISEDQRHDPCGNEDIRIAPVIIGAKNGGWLQVIVGIVLIVVGVILSFTPFAALSPFLINAGIGLAVAGVVSLLMPQPKMKKPQESSADNQPSYAFNGAVNTTAQGHPVPLLLGHLIVGSAVASAGLEAKDEVYVPHNGTVSGGGWIGNADGEVMP